MARDRGGRGHHGTHQVGTSAPALASFEVTIAGRGTALAGSENIGVHSQAHGAARFAPVKTSRPEHLVQPLFFRLPLHLLRTRNDHRAYMRMNVVPADYLGGGPEVLDAGVGAGADEDPIDGQLFD